MNEPCRLLAFVRPEGDNGPILAAGEGFFEAVHSAGWDISDHNMPCTDGVMYGLLLFEGWQANPEDDEPCLVGEWRRLTFWELSRVRHGLLPWG